MANRVLIRNITVAFVLFTLLFSGCTKKNNSKLLARTSAEWIKDAVIYEVNLHSFSREGTFNALEKRIPELIRTGVTVVSLMPIHPIGELNRKGSLGNSYAVKDYYAINPAFGTPDDFRSLVDALHRQDLKIVIDLAPGYAAWDSQLLMEEPDWFKHDEDGAIVSPEIELSDVAQLDFNQHEPKKYMIAVMKYWVKEFDIDGFKCSAAKSIPTNFWNIARKELDKIKTVMMISESSKPEYHTKAFDLTFSWNIYDIIVSIKKRTAFTSVFDDSLKYEFQQFPPGSLRLRFNEICKQTEDNRIPEKLNPEEIKIMAVIKFTIPGIPYLRNGEEVGDTKHLCVYDKVEINWSGGEDFRKLYEQLGALRRNHPALRDGSYSVIPNSELETIYSFLRSSREDSIISVINLSNEKKNVNLRMPAGSSPMWRDQLSNMHFRTNDSLLIITLLPWSFVVLAPDFERTAI